jgi:hypothetical protein
MAVEQPWALDFLSFGLAYPDRWSIKMGNTFQEEGGEPSEEEKAPAAEWEGTTPPTSLPAYRYRQQMLQCRRRLPILFIILVCV